MNKYQEALEKLCANKGYLCDYLLLQELVDKATPKKVVNKHHGWFQDGNIGRPRMGNCPLCNTEHHEDDRFCRNCGQALDFTE